jgi:hypothetical protein
MTASLLLGDRAAEPSLLRDSQLRCEVLDQASDLVRNLELGEVALRVYPVNLEPGMF